jgi:hypothetical protein
VTFTVGELFQWKEGCAAQLELEYSFFSREDNKKRKKKKKDIVLFIYCVKIWVVSSQPF